MTRLYINAGHGGKDGGAIGNGLKEKDLTLAIVLKMKKLLETYDVDLKFSRTTDKFVSLEDTTNEANEWKAHYFVSVHINAGGGEGFETFIHDKLSATSNTSKLRTIIHNEIIKEIGGKDRGKKSKNFHVLRETIMSAILTEVAFIDTVSDSKKLKDDDFLDKVAQGHVNGLVKAFDLKKKKVEEKKTVATHTHHLVRMGDTLSKIAEKNKVSVGEILEINPQIKNKNQIYIGNVLNIPKK